MVSPVAVAAGALFGGDYLLVEPLSEGGMGSVWIAEQQSTGARRAVKLMRPDLLSDERARERFVQEARVGAQIKSDHVVQALGAGVDQGIPWIAMELLEGETLAEWLAGRPFATRDETSTVFLELCHALAAAHDVGIVHRDLKPDNIFLARSRRPGAEFSVKILDFGIAKLLADAQARTTAAIGTPLWMAPEQTSVGGRIDPSTDVWALGLIAFRMLVGASYWNAGRLAETNVVALLREIALEPLAPASERATAVGGPPLPKDFDAWFSRCVARDMSARFTDARSAHDALQSVLGTDRALSAAPSQPMSKRSELAMAPTAPLAATISAEPVAAATSTSRTRPRSWLYVGIAVVSLGAIGSIALSRRNSNATVAAPDASAPAASASSPPASLPSSVIATASGWAHKSCPDGMRKIPGGTYKLGFKDVTATIAPFCLDEYEVSVWRYTECVEKTACPAGQTTVQSPVMDAADVKKWSPLCNFGHSDRIDHPMNCVDFHAAKSFCASARGRLPTEEEWEWAARGGEEARPYPWGAVEPPSEKKLLCWFRETGTLGTCQVGKFPDGHARWSIADLSGNVREWTDNEFDDEPEKRVFRGGCFGVQEAAHARVDVRAGMLPENRLHNVGFRCAATLAVGPSP
jgi:serine/threonine protein kinase